MLEMWRGGFSKYREDGSEIGYAMLSYRERKEKEVLFRVGGEVVCFYVRRRGR